MPTWLFEALVRALGAGHSGLADVRRIVDFVQEHDDNRDLLPEGFDDGESDWLTQDITNTRRGVTGFGRDVVGPKTMTWSSFVDADDVESALDVLARARNAWRPEEVIRTAGAQIPLRYRLANRDRRIYGRPRRFAAPPTNMILNGYVDVTHDFQTTDAYSYDDVASNADIPYASTSAGGGFVITPTTTWPVSTVSSAGNGSGQINIGGDARCYPIIRLYGNWTNPVFNAGDWTITWKGTIPTGGWIEIDTRPWVLTVTDQNGGNASGGLDRTVWLEDCWFEPGTNPSITLDGVAPTGAAHATVIWRNTWKSL